MNGIVSISEAATLALHAMVYLASREGLTPTADISSRFCVSTHHMAKVLQRMARSGLLRSERGPRGGFALARRSDAITLLDVYEAVEGTPGTRGCLLKNKSCRRGCIMGGAIAGAASLVRDRLRATRLSDAAASFRGGRA